MARKSLRASETTVRDSISQFWHQSINSTMF
jgi:hypothetical protein